MKLTPLQRRERLEAMIRDDTDCGRLLREYSIARCRFTEITERKQKKIRELLWSFPGTGYFLYHRVLMMVCEVMRFPDETE